MRDYDEEILKKQDPETYVTKKVTYLSFLGYRFFRGSELSYEALFPQMKIEFDVKSIKNFYMDLGNICKDTIFE